MSPDAARFPMAPTLTATLGGKGHRPVVGTWDCKHLGYVFAVVNLVTAAVHATLVDRPNGATKATGKGKARRLREAFAAHLRHVGRRPPAATHRRVVRRIDNAPWQAGEPVRAALADHPHRELKRRPSYRPQLNPIERFWRVRRRRATHNRLFETLADLRRSVRSSLSYFQTMRERVRSLLNRQPRKRTASAGS